MRFRAWRGHGEAFAIPHIESGVMPPQSKALRATPAVFMHHRVRHDA
jgi:hypothetical protein